MGCDASDWTRVHYMQSKHHKHCTLPSVMEGDFYLFKHRVVFYLQKNIPNWHVPQLPKPNYSFQRKVPLIQRSASAEKFIFLLSSGTQLFYFLIQEKNSQTVLQVLLVCILLPYIQQAIANSWSRMHLKICFPLIYPLKKFIQFPLPTKSIQECILNCMII